MKTLYVSDLKSALRRLKGEVAQVEQSLVAVHKELKTWRKGSENHSAALQQYGSLRQRLGTLKKSILENERLLKHPQVIRRNRIAKEVGEWVLATFPTLANARGLRVYVNDEPGGNVMAYTTEEKDWNFYAKSYMRSGGFPKIHHDVVIKVNPDWDKQVENRDLELLGGMVTLDAKPVHRGRYRKAVELADKLGIDLYEAVWLTKGRGYQVDERTGFIAVKRTSLGIIPHTAYHSESAMAAVEGSHRKFRNVCDLPLEIRDVPMDAVVTWADAKATGACESGVRNWCNQVRIDANRDSVPLIEVVRGYYLRPMPEAKAIILRVLRNHPRASKAA